MAVPPEELVFHFKDAKDVFLGHKAMITGMVINGHRLYTVGLDGRFLAYDIHDRAKVDEGMAAEPIAAIATDGTTMFAAIGTRIHTIRPNAGKTSPFTGAAEMAVTAIDVGEGGMGVGFADGTMRWYVGSDLAKQWRPHRGAVGGVCVTAKRIYSAAADGSASVLHKESGSSSVLVDASRRPLRCILETNGLVAIAAGPHVHIHKKDGSHKATLKHHTADIHQFLGDREWLFSAGGDRRVAVWSMAKLEPVLIVVSGHSNRVKSMALLGSTLYTGSGDKTVRVFDLKEAFTQRAEWAKTHKAKSKKFGLFGKQRGKVNDTRGVPAAAPVAPVDAPVKTLRVTHEDMDMLAGWEAQMAQQAEIDKEKDEEWKTKIATGVATVPTRRRGGSSSTQGSKPKPRTGSTPSPAVNRTPSPLGGGGAPLPVHIAGPPKPPVPVPVDNYQNLPAPEAVYGDQYAVQSHGQHYPQQQQQQQQQQQHHVPPGGY